MLTFDSIFAAGLSLLALLFVLWRFGRTIWEFAQDPAVQGLLGLVLFILLSGTFVYRALEGWSYLDSLYFTVITLTTVGYGDITPKTEAGKIFTMIYLLSGLGVLSSFVVLVAEKSQKLLQRPGKDKV